MDVAVKKELQKTACKVRMGIIATPADRFPVQRF